MSTRFTRYTASPEGEVTVFLIGMRVNSPLQVRRWGPVVMAMPRMLRYLSSTPEAGMLGHHQWFGRTTILLSYWRSPEHLQRFAADAEGPHLEPWRRFRALAQDGDVGVWHETYVAGPGSREAVYANMGEGFGLAGALGAVQMGAGLQTHAQRLRAVGQG
ncbi:MULTISPECIES: DUF4188 domain-containing protein [Kytococcus]|uniref:DUF4188 domain-containing protein n=1 Tax=Kytococcus TaxID=57499 RepID=UPI0008A3D7D7|nr:MULTISPECIES: DUF4188 domain-containing protein [Kytococcus]OFS15682.1 hypothetical protein HMPREF3099_01530 [Kytococcus sp. HMSC28H12]